ncbi:hypothetical protein SARC_00509 [Sphaeroforma arctica JP610]|uniref:Disintegrin domain-containing protein n=1 Tax=Sphaeroforma arctica JP610 TaxID=667725 RepID=A0A0L0GGC8_9EUKA|nr:hypothetical protein SARC_00509 [Sphaeroforma arctica JP610]KNC87368.1 hypothetical protein SARC_00509 [Sphaeroforma arctica JP610]|eukprot:XP_014161270.1 hypothetical protein SARC_00509 [Sphaeroforma arctica JP610]
MYTGTLRMGDKIGTANGYIYDGHYHGVVRTEEETYFIEPAQKFSKYAERRSADRVIYRASDVHYTHPKGQKFNGVDLFPPISVVMHRNRREESRRREVSKGTCQLKLVADHTFANLFPTDTVAAKHMSLIASEVDNIFSKTTFSLDVRVALSKNSPIDVYPSKDSYPETLAGLGNEQLSPTTLLAEFAKGDWDDYCLAHLFTHREHHGILGESYEATPIEGIYGGICANSSQSSEGLNLNTGMHTNLMYGQPVSLAIEIIAATHSIGHGFGASHDPFHTGPCLGGSNNNRYIMTNTTFNEVSSNNDDFSTCSVDNINQLLESDKMADSCLTEEPSKVCGNGIVEGDEECDTFGATKCCTNKCELADNAVCTANDGCCDPDTCDYAKKDTQCAEATGCMAKAVCNGNNAKCPEQKPVKNFTPCGAGNVLYDAWICMDGKCGNELGGNKKENNLCAAFDGAESCDCPQKENECQMCCKFPSDEGVCQTVEDHCALDGTTDKACFDGDKSVSAYFEGGYPCADYKGHCDGRGTCEMAILPQTPIRHQVLLDSPLWRPVSKPVQSNFVSLSMEYSSSSIHFAFENNRTSPRIEELLELLKVEKGERPTYIRVGGNSVMKLEYAGSKYKYPDYVYVEKAIENDTLIALKDHGMRSGDKYILALPMMEPDPKYAVEFGEAIVDIFGGTDMIHALEMGNEPDHWGDNKEDKVNLLRKRPHYEFKGHGRIAFKDYLEEVTGVMLPALSKSNVLKKVGLQSPAIAGSNTNTWPHWNDNLLNMHNGMKEAMDKAQMTTSDSKPITAFHRYGMSGYSVRSSMETFMADPPTDGADESRNTMEWIGKMANQIEEKGGEFVHGEGNTVTGSGRSVLKGLRGIDRSYEAGVWMFNNLLELASRNVTRSHVHGVCGSSFAPLYVPYLYQDKDEPDFERLRVTPIYGGMYFFNRLLDGGKDAMRISVPSAYIGPSVGNPPNASDPVGVSPFYKHYHIQNVATEKQSLVYIHKDPTENAAWMKIEIPKSFCPSQKTLAVQRMTKQKRSEATSNAFDQFTTNLNGIWFDHEAAQYGSLNKETVTLNDNTKLWHINMEPLTAVVVICDSLMVTSERQDTILSDDSIKTRLVVAESDSEKVKELKKRLQVYFDSELDDATEGESDPLEIQDGDSSEMQDLKETLREWLQADMDENQNVDSVDA